MRTFLEFFRIVAILIMLGAGGGMILASLYSSDSGTEPYTWLGGIAVLLLIFVLYRNKLQFSGWYKGKGRDKLPRTVTILLLSASLLLLVSPFIFSALFSAGAIE
ncbi:hypothetical protein [Planococcus sp. ISL-109]|uniref:hypothetical protein n=1 Tax=Planococcus sp. ISL-109 TaxID=2819166 RepID=UPI001BE59DCB|nr:hypothetical protein [Planococcus sp. ISL-109]MBT2583289.1 hypothetical protein [Planococcus sp. ISL-109]